MTLRSVAVARTLVGLVSACTLTMAFNPPPLHAATTGVTPLGRPAAVVHPDVEAAASRGESLDVIVSLSAAAPADAPVGSAEAGVRRAGARAAVDRVTRSLPSGSLRSVRGTENFALANLRLSADGLEALRRSPDVREIGVNRAHPAALAASVPHIGGDVAAGSGFTGSGQTVAILDTGVDATHPFLGGRVVAEACFSTNDPDRNIEGFCPGADNTTATGAGSGAPCSLSSCSHGTHVAGIAAGKGDSFTGVAPEATIISVQVFSRVDSTTTCGGSAPCTLFYDFDLTRGLDFVFGLTGSYNIAAANMSLGGFYLPGFCDFNAQKVPIDKLRSKGVASVIASGNDGQKNGISLPGCISTAVSVGATDKFSDSVAGFSNSSKYLSLLAPGLSINSSVPGGGFGFKSGTSMATPHVVGAFAVLRQAYPDMTVTDRISILRATGLPVTDVSNGITTPRIRLDAAVRPPTFHPIDPVRLLDTRDGTGTNTAGLPLGPGGALDLLVRGVGGIPATGVSGVVLNVTGVLPSDNTHLTVYPAGFPKPDTSNLNLVAFDIRPNLVTAKIGAGGKVTLANSSGTVHVLADLAGWIDDGGVLDTGTHHEASLPTRIADTRDGTGGVPTAKVGAGQAITVDVGAVCATLGAVAASINLTATAPDAPTHLTAYPAGAALPNVSNVNVDAGETSPNFAMVKLSAGGTLSITNNAGNTDIIVDLFGCEIPGTSADLGGRMVPSEPARVVDTRSGLGVPVAGKVPGISGIAVQLGGRGGVPSANVRAVIVNITATGSTAGSHVSVAPTGLSLSVVLQLANTSVLNFDAGQTVANQVIAPVGPDGQMVIANFVGETHLIVDVVGWVTD